MDELERLVRDANTAPVRRDSPMSSRGEADLAAILSTSPGAARPAPRWRRTIIWSSAIAAGLAIILTATFQLTAPRAAASPPALTYIPIARSLSSELERLGEVARQNIPTTSSSVLISETWSADISVGDSATTTFVQPREVTRTFNSDGSSTLVVLAGEVRWGVVSSGSEAAAPRSELERYEFGPGESPRLGAPPLSSSGADLRAYFDATLGLSAASPTGDYFAAIQSLRDEWALDGEQTVAVTELLASLPDVTLLGETTDRLGRTGIAFATSTSGNGTFQTVLIFDSTTGELIAFESTYLGGNPDVHLPAQSVVNYIAWKDQP